MCLIEKIEIEVEQLQMKLKEEQDIWFALLWTSARQRLGDPRFEFGYEGEQNE